MKAFLISLAVLAVLAALLVIRVFDPASHGFYPVCYLHETTGLLCPGCGILRATHQLTCGNLAAAWKLNPLFVSLLPVGAWLLFRECYFRTTRRRLPGMVTHPAFAWTLAAVIMLFGVLRNLPWGGAP